MTSIDPATSSTYRPGYVPNEGVTYSGGQGSNAYWRQTLAEYMASEWAQGNRDKVLEIISPSWYSDKYGEPDPSDQYGEWSSRTLSAFSRWAANYKPGMSSYIDQVLPYVAPGPNDFIEDPTQTATRIAMEQWEKDWAFRNAESEADRAFRGSEGAANRAVSMAGIDQQAKAAAMNAFNDAFQNEISKYGTQAGLYSNQEQNKQSAYGTQAGIYSNQESTRSANLQQAGSLSSQFQQLLDARTNKAIEAQLNPGDFLAREAQVRAIAPPVGTETPAFKDDETLKKIIDALINYKPNAAPQAPVVPDMAAPVAPTIGTFQAPTTPAIQSTPSGQLPPPPSNYITPEEMDRLKAAAGLQHAAYGMRMGKAHEFVSGDPQADGEPNPEIITIHNPGKKTRVDVTPIKNAMQMRGKRKMAYGADMFDPATLKLKSYPDEAYQNYPTLSYFQGRTPKAAYNTLATGAASGAFGAQLPESGAINYGRYLDVAKDPVSLAMLSSSYKSGSRDLMAEVARAKARAPFGQAVQTSLIRT